MAETHGANFEASDVLRMFPTFVWKAQMAPSVNQEIEDDVLAKLDEMRRDAGEPAPGRGWPSEKHLYRYIAGYPARRSERVQEGGKEDSSVQHKLI